LAKRIHAHDTQHENEKKQTPDTRAAGPALLEWDGRLFHTAGDFRNHLLARGVDWTAFADTHPAAVSALRIPSVTWGGKAFFTQGSLNRWLARTGVGYRAWAKKHPTARAILAGEHGAGATQPAKTPSRALAAAPIVTWDGIEFTKAAGLKDYLAAKKINWNAFLAAHPAIVEKFELGSRSAPGVLPG